MDLYLAKKAYDKALSALRSELSRKPGDIQLLRRQGQIQELADDFGGAIETYLELAHEYILEGFHTRAIALYKRILEIDPTRQDILAELARLIDREGSAAVPAVAVGEKKKKGPSTPEEQSELTEPTIDSAISPPRNGDPSAAEPVAATGDGAVEPSILEIRPAVPPADELPGAAGSTGSQAKELAASSLFTLFDSAALEAVLTSTNLCSYQEGDIIVTEGEEGASLFLLVDGQVKVFTRGKRGEHIPLAELGPGDVFGEVSVLYGKPRTATITARSRISAIEVTKEDIDRIAADHPQVRQVLQEFCERRAQHAIETLIRRAQE